jgi:hypothetical protein
MSRRAGADGCLLVSAISRLLDGAEGSFGFAADDGQQDASGAGRLGAISLAVLTPGGWLSDFWSPMSRCTKSGLTSDLTPGVTSHGFPAHSALRN